MASVILVFFLLVCAAAAVDNKSSGSGFDLDMIEEKIGGFREYDQGMRMRVEAMQMRAILWCCNE